MAEADVAGLVICDAGPLIHLDELGCLELLRDFADVQVPETVWQEVQRHRPSALRRRTVKLHRIACSEDTIAALAEMLETLPLDPGEMEALALAHAQPGAIFLTDDAAARLAAEQLNCEVHGSIGIVVRALRRGQRSKRQVLRLLRAIPEKSTLFITPELLGLVIAEITNG